VDSALQKFTDKQGQYLAFIHAYSLALGRPPAEADIQRFFAVTPPTVHQMVLTLERKASSAARQAARAASVSSSTQKSCQPFNPS
jgi:hypothetical protein